MNLTITSHQTKDYLFIKCVGVLEDAQDLMKQAELIYGETQKYEAVRKILIDDLETRFPTDMLAYFSQVEFFSSSLPAAIRQFKIAVVLSPEFGAYGEFWENVAVNRGFQYFSFTSVEEAQFWLTKD